LFEENYDPTDDEQQAFLTRHSEIQKGRICFHDWRKSMKRNSIGIGLVFIFVFLALTIPAHPEDVETLFKEIFPVPSVTGNEELMAAKIVSLLPGRAAVEKDNLGSLYARTGPEPVSFAIVTALDEFGYIVSSITPDGYLRVDRPQPPPLPIYDSFLMGHPVMIITRSGPVIGVVSQPSLHIMAPGMREMLEKGPTLDMIYIDIGAHSEFEARDRGIEILDPVTFPAELVTLAEGRVAGPSLGRKSACAAAAAAFLSLFRSSAPAGTACVWMAQTRMTARGYQQPLGAVRAKLKLMAKTVLVLGAVEEGRDEKSPKIGMGPILVRARGTPSRLAAAVAAVAAEMGLPLQESSVPDAFLETFSSDTTAAVLLAIPVKFAGTPSEVVDLKDVQAAADIAAGVAAAWRAQ
jgi:putative aminopeptidase FrvX